MSKDPERAAAIRKRVEINPSSWILALLEYADLISPEVAHVVDGLTAGVLPLNYAAVKETLATALGELPPWHSCNACRNAVSQFKGQVVAIHANDHKLPTETGA